MITLGAFFRCRYARFIQAHQDPESVGLRTHARLKNVIGDSTSPCFRQNSCNCSRCMASPPTSLVPVRPLKLATKNGLLITLVPGTSWWRNFLKGPTRPEFREKIAAVESSNELLDRLLARVQDPAPQETESRAVSSIYFSCRFTKMRRRDPHFSLRKIIQGWFSEISPLESNLVSHYHDRSVAEIFLPEEYKEQARCFIFFSGNVTLSSHLLSSDYITSQPPELQRA